MHVYPDVAVCWTQTEAKVEQSKAQCAELSAQIKSLEAAKSQLEVCACPAAAPYVACVTPYSVSCRSVDACCKTGFAHHD